MEKILGVVMSENDLFRVNEKQAYAKVASMDELKENDFNLNIPLCAVLKGYVL
jgi:type I restriction-modification system DNA methylase subunit